ncbi:DNA helicase-2/ATP-dependent DNA helicase PcrA [Agromyces flavus]|uniref:DNA 3'-5' helicase n=1 Tax=Agromyces flavus TaxID=589382 RepID=A0A1H1NPI6_9MICO|nr:ATP-dependent helicase [Agromyces flavus]MCP2369064.1 DNA helicase-2/ATP-dependent DNA helicase PcrA [Agromyces flavus]GGI48542.1 DNA helicase [Agromyces flavus]SDS00229.1 ATP-dependent DNA helicase, Rep family [Agromyces flavus]
MTDADPLLAALDDEQRIVAEALNGPVCVLAGAGTGKTRAITHRIAYGVASGSYDPARVMALTFTTRAAAELRARLRALGAGGVQARTFHAAALAQLNHFWPIVAGGPAPRVLEFKGRLLGLAAERCRLKVDTATLRDVAAEIEVRKVTGLSMDEYRARLASRGAPGTLDAEQLLSLVDAYETLKDERRMIDFEDVLLATAGMIESEPAVAMQVREGYRHFVVDEYQDVSPAQQQLLDLWLGDRDEVCVVGDASQTIYSFAGASAEYLLGFERRHPEATLVRLERNYRSTPEIVEVANRLMRGRPGALRLVAAPADGGDPAVADGAAAPPARPAAAAAAHGVAPVVVAFPDELTEARGVATRIRARIDAGVPAEAIAVLLRVNSQSALLEQALGEVGVPARVRGAQRFFDRAEVRQAVHAIRAQALAATDEPVFKAVSDVLRSLDWSVEPPPGPGAVRDRWESLNAIARLVDDLPPGTTLRAFADDLRARAEAQHEPAIAAVTLATLHSAKGLEWDEVHLVGLTEGMLPIAYATGLEAIDEERRLLYVGLTRARRRLTLSWAARAAAHRGEREPSRFLRELDIRTPDARRSAGVPVGANRPRR